MSQRLFQMEFAEGHQGVSILPTFWQNGSKTELFSQDMVSVDFDINKYNRLTSTTLPLEDIITNIWNSKTEANQRIYNASKFRLAGVKFVSDSNLELRVGLTDYRDLLGTHYSNVTKELIAEAKERIESDQNKTGIFDEFGLMGNAIGVGAIAITNDNYVILIERSSWTGESAGKVDRPGGHPEPEEAMKPRPSETDEVKTYQDINKFLDPKGVLKEIFESPQKELRDEINIQLEDQEDPKLLGRIFDLDYGGRVGLDFLVRIKLSKEEVLKRYSNGQQKEADETTGLIFLPLEDVLTNTVPQSLISRFTNHCIGGLRLAYKFMHSNHSI